MAGSTRVRPCSANLRRRRYDPPEPELPSRVAPPCQSNPELETSTQFQVGAKPPAEPSHLSSFRNRQAARPTLSTRRRRSDRHADHSHARPALLGRPLPRQHLRRRSRRHRRPRARPRPLARPAHPRDPVRSHAPRRPARPHRGLVLDRDRHRPHRRHQLRRPADARHPPALPDPDARLRVPARRPGRAEPPHARRRAGQPVVLGRHAGRGHAGHGRGRRPLRTCCTARQARPS